MTVGSILLTTWVAMLPMVTHGFSTVTPQSPARSGGDVASSDKQPNPPVEPKPPLQEDTRHWKIASTEIHPNDLPLTPALQEALESNTHPVEDQSTLGQGTFVSQDWRRAWHNYESPLEDPDLIDPLTGAAQYVMEVEGSLPEDLHGVLYRNGPGKFGLNGHRVQHALDGDALVLQITIPPPDKEAGERKVQFQSRFVETETFVKEREADRYLVRGTFGSGPRGDDKGPGLNEDPVEPSLWEKIRHNALKVDVKNSANTHVVAYGGKLLTLFEAGLPHRIDPVTLQNLGEDNLDGVVPSGTCEQGKTKGKVAVTMKNMPEGSLPDFLGGAAHTAHPKLCPRTGNMVGWHWQQVADTDALRITFTEWSTSGEKGGMEVVGTSSFDLPGCGLAPHDMALTENYVVLKVNALTLNRLPFLAGIQGPAAALAMDGRSPVKAFVFPRPSYTPPTSQEFPITIDDVPACFSIHVSHSYENKKTGNIVMYFSGWPASDSKDFLGAWGGFAPVFNQIPLTFLWRLEIDPAKKRTVSLEVAPGCENICLEHPVTHPEFVTRDPQFTYAVVGNLIGDSTAPCGYVRLPTPHATDAGKFAHLKNIPQGDRNEDVDTYFFGSRYFAGEPLVVPKAGPNADMKDETKAYLLGIVQDCAVHKSFVAVFDLERPLRDGPVCKLWLKSAVPHGLHGCFVPSDSATSYARSFFG
jgi:all-trans-8'-apo-beta-carotenal 15,15'-oxygenase